MTEEKLEEIRKIRALRDKLISAPYSPTPEEEALWEKWMGVNIEGELLAYVDQLRAERDELQTQVDEYAHVDGELFGKYLASEAARAKAESALKAVEARQCCTDPLCDDCGGIIKQAISAQPPNDVAETLREAAAEMEASLKALQANDWHHTAYDEFEGYPDSSLEEQNTAAIIGTRNTLAKLRALVGER